MDVCDARALAGPGHEEEAVRKLRHLARFPVSVGLLQAAGKGAVKQVSVKEMRNAIFQLGLTSIIWLSLEHTSITFVVQIYKLIKSERKVST